MNNILYVTKPFYLDFDLPLIARLKESLDIHVLILITPHSKSATIFDLNDVIFKQGFIEINLIKHHLPEYYENFIDFKKTYIYNTNSSSAKSFKNILGQFHLFKFARKYNNIYTNGFLPLSFLYPLFSKSLNLFLNIHDPFPHTGESNFIDQFLKKLNIKKAKKLILYNKNQTDRFVKTHNLTRNQYINVNIGLYETYNFLKINNKTCFNFNFKKPTLFFFGRIVKYKGIEFLIDAVNELNREGIKINTIIAGAGKPYFDINKIDNAHTTFINRYLTQYELADLLQNIDAVVCPYTDATQSGVIMTSYTFGKPVISTDTGGLSEMLVSQNLVYLAKPKSVSSLKNKIKLWYDNYKYFNYEKVISECYEVGDKSWDNTAKKIIEHLNS